MSDQEQPLSCEYRCLPCREIPHVDWDDWLGPGQYDSIDHHASVQALSASAALGCRLCRVFWWSLFQYSDPYALYDAHDLPEGACSVRFTMLPTGGDGGGGNELAVKFFVGRRARTVFVKGKRVSCVGEMSWDLEGVDGVVSPGMTGIRLFQPETKEKDLGSLVDEVVNPWISKCCDTHALCRENDATEDLTLLPTRLIDVSDESTLFLRDTATDIPSFNNGGTPPYLILSYCWGGSSEGITTWANVEDRRRIGFNRDEFAQTIQEALKLTRKMGFKYLWIDAVCIVQPTKTAGMDDSDWRRQAPRMKDYYRNALCTIAASRARKGDHGFLSERLASRFGFPEACVVGTRKKIRGDSQGGEDAQDHLLLYAERVSWEDEFGKQPLMTRGWCFQEWLLSRRVLHFSRNATFWECRSLRGASEGDPTRGLSDGDDVGDDLEKVGTGGSTEERLLAVRRILDAGTLKEDIPFLWARVVDVYCRLELSYETDRLVAIQGVADKLMGRIGSGTGTPSLKGEYAAGVFRKSLAGLLWKGPSVSKGHMSNMAPSWSWASIPTRSLVQLEAQTTRPAIGGYMHSLVEPVGREHFPGDPGVVASLEGRRLTLRAPVFTVDFGERVVGQRFHDTLCPGKVAPKKDEDSAINEAEQGRAAKEAQLWGAETKFHVEFDATYLVPQPNAGKLTMVFIGCNRQGEEKYPQFFDGVRFRMFGIVVRRAVVPEDAFLRVGHVTVSVREDGREGLVDGGEGRREIALV